MITRYTSRRSRWMGFVIPLTALCAAAMAGSPAEDLTRAVALYDDAQYAEAQRLLQAIDPSGLSDEQRQTRDRCLTQLLLAAPLAEKAEAQRRKGSELLAKGELDAAERQFKDVLANRYASDSLKESCQAQLNVIAARRSGSKGAVVLASDHVPPAEKPSKSASKEADRLVEQANAAMQAGDHAKAVELFEAALGLVPGHPEAARGLEQARLFQKVESGDTSLVDRVRWRHAVLWDKAAATYRQTAQEVRDAVEKNDFEVARQGVEYARQIIEANKQYADPIDKYDSLRDEVQALADHVSEREEAYHVQRATESRVEAEQEQARRLDLTRTTREKQIDQLMERAEQLKKEERYPEAAGVLQQVLVIDPRYKQAQWMLEYAQERMSYRSQRSSREKNLDETRALFDSIDDAAVPRYDDDPRYPANWPEITNRSTRQPPGHVSAYGNEDVFARLDRPIPDLNFQNTEFAAVMGTLREATGTNLVVNWRDLEAAKIRPDDKLSMKVTNVPARTALKLVLDQMGSGRTDLDYLVSGGVIQVATKDRLNKETYAEVYNIQDLLMEVPDFVDGPDMSISVPEKKETRAWESILPENEKKDKEKPGDLEEKGRSRSKNERVASIKALIQESVARGSWRELGGNTDAAIVEQNGQLVITQTAGAHGQIQDLLSKLREDRSIQVAIESRFITVQSNFLEEMGIDIDVILNNGNAGFDRTTSGIDPVTGGQLLLPRQFTRLGFTPAVPGVGAALGASTPITALEQPYGNVAVVPQRGGYGGADRFTPLPIQHGFLDITDPRSLSSDLPGSFAGRDPFAPAFQIFGSFLDNIQVDFLVRATQADSRTTVLTAPRLVLHNGQRAWIALTNEQNFVQTLQPVVAAAAAAQAPGIGTVRTGAVLDVQAAVSPDKRYVTMNLFPQVGRLIGINSFSFTQGPFSGVGASGSVQLPIISSQRMKTTVDVPDGGTLLIGGQKQSFETEIEAGVPVLSKIPVLKRAFSSRTTVRDEQVLLILIKPHIIIRQEAEEAAFPTLSQR